MEGYSRNDSVREEKERFSKTRRGSCNLEYIGHAEKEEEAARKRRELEDQIWPAIRPPVKGVSRILTNPGKRDKSGNLMEIDLAITQETGSSVAASMERNPGMAGEESEKRKKRHIGNEEEIEKLNRQIRMLADERRKLREGRTSQKGKPRIISNVQIVPPRGDIRKMAEQEEQQEGEWIRVVRRRDSTKTTGSEGIGKWYRKKRENPWRNWTEKAAKNSGSSDQGKERECELCGGTKEGEAGNLFGGARDRNV